MLFFLIVFGSKAFMLQESYVYCKNKSVLEHES